MRDQLNINTDNPYQDFGSVKQQQFEVRAQLRADLGSLPAPKNDFEIVLPGDHNLEEPVTDTTEFIIEDASEIDERSAKLKKTQGMDEYTSYIHNMSLAKLLKCIITALFFISQVA